jgi:hypothetical protein
MASTWSAVYACAAAAEPSTGAPVVQPRLNTYARSPNARSHSWQNADASNTGDGPKGPISTSPFNLRHRDTILKWQQALPYVTKRVVYCEREVEKSDKDKRIDFVNRNYTFSGGILFFILVGIQQQQQPQQRKRRRKPHTKELVAFVASPKPRAPNMEPCRRNL